MNASSFSQSCVPVSVECKDNTSKDPFSQCENLKNWQGIHLQVKSQFLGTLTTTEVMTRMRRATSTTTCLMWTQTWSMWTRTSTPTEDLWVPFVCCSIVLVLVVSVVLVWFLAHHTLPQLSSRAQASHGHRHFSCARWVTSSSTSLLTFPISSSLPSTCSSYCLSPSSSLISWDYSHAHCRWGERSPWQEQLLHMLMSPTTTSSRRLMSSSTRSPWPSNGSLKTSTTMTSPSVRRSSMRAEDEPITLKEKACRPVCCRRQYVMIELWDQLFAVTQVTRMVKKFRDKTLKTNRLGLYWTDRGSKSSLIFKRRFKSTNSRLIMTEEVYKNWLRRSSRRKNFIVLKQKNNFDEINNFFMNSY